MWVVEINHFSRVSFGQLGKEEFLPPSLLWSRKKCVRKNKMNASRLCQGFVKSSKSDYFWLKFNDLHFLFLRVVSSMLWRNRVRVNLKLAQLILLMRLFYWGRLGQWAQLLQEGPKFVIKYLPQVWRVTTHQSVWRCMEDKIDLLQSLVALPMHYIQCYWLYLVLDPQKSISIFITSKIP